MSSSYVKDLTYYSYWDMIILAMGMKYFDCVYGASYYALFAMREVLVMV